MKTQAYCLIFLIASCMAAACSSTKHTTSSVVKANDTVIIALHDTFRDSHIEFEKLYIRDTVIKIEGATAVQVIRPRQMIPGANYTTTSGHVHSRASIDSAGNIHILCKADSLNLVIRNLVERTLFQAKEIERLSRSSTVKSSHTESTYKDYYKKTRSWLAGNWYWLFLALIVATAAEIVYRWYKKHRNRNPLL